MAVDYFESQAARFNSAVRLVSNLPKDGTFQPSDHLKLQFYAYFKQATFGPCQESKPKFWDPVKRAKWQAWKGLSDMPKEEAMRNYVDTLRQVVDTMEYSEEVQNFLSHLDERTSGKYELCQNKNAVNGWVNNKTDAELYATSNYVANTASSDGFPTESVVKVGDEIVKRALASRKSDPSSSNSCLSDEDAYKDACDVQTHVTNASWLAINGKPGQQNSLDVTLLTEDEQDSLIIADANSPSNSVKTFARFDRYNACTFAENWFNRDAVSLRSFDDLPSEQSSSGATVVPLNRYCVGHDDKSVQCARDTDNDVESSELHRAALSRFGRLLSHVSDEPWHKASLETRELQSSRITTESNGLRSVPSNFLARAFDRISHVLYNSITVQGFGLSTHVAKYSPSKKTALEDLNAERCLEVWLARLNKCEERLLSGQKELCKLGVQETRCKLNPAERRALHRWRPRFSEKSAKSKKVRGGSNVAGAKSQKDGCRSGDDGEADRIRSSSVVSTTLPTRTELRRTEKKTSSSSESESTESSSEWDPHVGYVLLRMHGQLRRLGRQMEFVQTLLLAQQQLIKNSHFVKSFSWKSVFVLTVWPVVINFIIRFAWRRFLRNGIRSRSN